MIQTSGIVRRTPVTQTTVANRHQEPDPLIVHLRAEHGWPVSFTGWRHEDLVALHGAEHDEYEPPTAA